jgi:hypothetical protein
VRKAVDDVAEKQQREKCYYHHGEKFHGKNIAEIFHAVKIVKNTGKNNKSTNPENKPIIANIKIRHQLLPFFPGLMPILLESIRGFNNNGRTFFIFLCFVNKGQKYFFQFCFLCLRC